jgi:GTP-binding protein
LDIRSAVFHRAAYHAGDFPRDGRPQFAVVGRSNVGKSSFINTLLGRKSLARVSQTPGKTQAIQFYLINERFYVVDLPGYGYAKVPRAVFATWGELIRSYFDEADTLKLVFLLVDARRTPTEGDVMMRDWLEAADRPWRLVITKVDKISNNDRARSRRDIAEAMDAQVAPIEFSKITKQGLDEVRRAMA